MGIFDFLKNKEKTSKKHNTKTTNNFSNISINRNSLDNEFTEIPKDYSSAVFLDYVNGKKVGKTKDDYYGYVEYDLGITNPVSKHKQLITKGYLKEASLENYLNTLKVANLKDILKQNNLKVTGKKSDLITRILENIDNNMLSKKYKNEFGYVLSEKGIKYLKDNENYVQLFKHKIYQITPTEFDKYSREMSNNSKFNDIVKNIIELRIEKYNKEKNFGFLRNEYYHLSRLLNEENKKQEALENLIMVLYYDLSGISSFSYINNKVHLYIYDDINRLIAPGIANYTYKLNQYYDKDMIKKVYDIELPFRYFDMKTFEIIINQILNGEEYDLKKYKKYAHSPKDYGYKKVKTFGDSFYYTK